MKQLLYSIGLLLTLGYLMASHNPLIAQQATTVSAWPKGVTYEIYVQSFADSDGDGKGDIKGMTAKLDYLKELGVEGIWLMPMNNSPSYHKYDVTDYYSIHPDYGTLDDFKEFIAQAHRRNIKVIMDMVINHSSNQHPWFTAAKTNINSPYWDYYVWTHKDDPQTQVSGKIISGDSDNRNRWHKVQGSDYLYYGYFSGSMPDLNYDSPKLRDEMFKVGKFWLSEVKVDGFRLDAARHIFPDDRPQDNHRWWVYFRNEMKKVNPAVFLVGEVWAPVDVVAPYLKGLSSSFNFDLAAAILQAVNTERADSLAFKHQQIRAYYTSVNPQYVDATFLTNHDQNRVMSAVNNNGNKAKMAASILLTLPGSPYLYYGEEIGMPGRKPDPYIREPFLWDVKAKDKIRTHWEVSRYATDSTVVSAAQQQNDPHSLYAHYKTLIHLRNTSKALTYGELEPLNLGQAALLAFVRSTPEESLLVVHNLSKAAVSLSLPDRLKGYSKRLFNSEATSSTTTTTIQVPAYGTVILGK